MVQTQRQQKNIIGKIACFVSVVTTHLAVLPLWAETALQREMIDTTRAIFRTMSVAYAPREWKEEFQDVRWSAKEEREAIIKAIQDNHNITIKQFHKLLLNSLRKTHDYHVSLTIFTQEKATLPFLLKPAGNRYFVVGVQEGLNLPLEVGDEIITFGGRSVHKVVEDLIRKHSGNTKSLTEKIRTTQHLTIRLASFGYDVSKGKVVIGVKKKAAKNVQNISMVWNYEPDHVSWSPIRERFRRENSLDSLEVLSFFSSELNISVEFMEEENGFLSSLLEKNMLFSQDEQVSQLAQKKGVDISRHTIGAMQSFLPKMGEVVQSIPSPFFNYIFEHKGKKIGYIRIKDYIQEMLGFRSMSDFFSDLIRVYDQQTDLLIIDQIHNPGGHIAYLYELVSMLITEPIAVPKHSQVLTVELVSEAKRVLELSSRELEKMVEDQFNSLGLQGDYIYGFLSKKELLRITKNDIRDVIDSYENSQTDSFLSTPISVLSDVIFPHFSGVSYSKPIVVLVDELSISGGDFFPAILQDGKRATIFGQTTAGAGGYARKINVSSHLGITELHFTGSIAFRKDGSPIESKGVTPDVGYSLTPDDYQNNFRSYKKALLKTVDKILQN